MNKAILLLVGGDLTAAVLAHGLAVSLEKAALPPSASWWLEGEIYRLAIFVAVLIVSGFLAELYAQGKTNGSNDLWIRIGCSLALTATLLSVIDYFLDDRVAFGWLFLVTSLAAFVLLQLGWHRNFHYLLRVPGIAQKVMILGAGPVAEQIEKVLAASQHNYILTGPAPRPPGSPAGAPQVPPEMPGHLARTAVLEKVDTIVISLTERRGVLPVREILGCKLSGIEIVDAMSFYEQMTGKLMVEKITPSWFIFSNGSRVTPFMRFYKRGFDLLFALVAIILVMPLLPLIALAIRFDTGEPILFKQVRVGMGEKDFVLYKFRTMHPDAERQTGAIWASENDPRVTRVGRFLRHTRLDEVPQLFNVLRGDMSFVGPRPERPEFVAKLKEEIPFYSNRHYVKPGATGWAQVKYSYGASVEDALEKLRYDLYYIKNYSLFLDFLIILETIKVVLFGRGAR